MLHHFQDKLVLTDFTQNDFEKNLVRIYDLLENVNEFSTYSVLT